MRNQISNTYTPFFKGLLFGLVALSFSQNINASIRFPASYLQSDMGPVPDMITGEILQEDDSGVLDSMRQNFEHWQAQETFADQWNLESTGLYVFPNQNEKRAYFQRMMLKYVDKRVSGELKKQQNDPTNPNMQQVATINNIVQPAGGMVLGHGVKFKIRARPIQGRVFLIIQNPIMDYETKMSLDGRVIMSATRNIESLGIRSGINYDMHYHSWEAHVDKQLTETLMARASSSGKGSDQVAFESGTNKTFQLIYSTSF